jgi:hypothetical protein
MADKGTDTNEQPRRALISSVLTGVSSTVLTTIILAALTLVYQKWIVGGGLVTLLGGATNQSIDEMRKDLQEQINVLKSSFRVGEFEVWFCDDSYFLFCESETNKKASSRLAKLLHKQNQGSYEGSYEGSLPDLPADAVLSEIWVEPYVSQGSPNLRFDEPRFSRGKGSRIRLAINSSEAAAITIKVSYLYMNPSTRKQ